MNKRITVQMLEAAGSSRLEDFEALFPNGFDVTVANAIAVADKFSFIWALYNLMTKVQQDAWQVAMDDLSNDLDDELITDSVAWAIAFAKAWTQDEQLAFNFIEES